MSAAIASHPAAEQAAGRPPRRGAQKLSIAASLSLLLHTALVILLIMHPVSKGVPKPQPRRLVLISLDSLRDPGRPSTQAAQLPQPAKEPPKLQPVPVPPDAQAVPKKVAPPKKPPVRAAAAPHPPQAAPAPPQTSPPTPLQKQGDEGESLGLTVLGRVRENWLRPVSAAATFHCRLRIDYLAGGTISNVVVLEGCGNNPLDDSVERAVWKTQPLPLGPAQQGPGSLVLEFTP